MKDIYISFLDEMIETVIFRNTATH